MKETASTYIDVVLPLSLQGSFTYIVPEDWNNRVKIGCRVIVPLGKRKYYTAIVLSIHSNPPQNYVLKEALELIDIAPVLLPSQIKLWKWIADYYLCTLGEVYKAALPSGMKMESETLVKLSEKEETIEGELSGSEKAVLETLKTITEIRLSKLSQLVGIANLLPIVQRMVDKGYVTIKETLRDNYRKRYEERLCLNPKYNDNSLVDDLLKNWGKRALKQRDLLCFFLNMIKQQLPEIDSISKSALLNRSKCSSSILNGLVKKEILNQYKVEIGHFTQYKGELTEFSPLNKIQNEAKDAIEKLFQVKPVVLLYGVTSSGKTEIYIHLIKELLEQQQQVLYLLPEIALTTQITRRLYRVFGNKLGVYHSRLSDAERVDIWKKQLSENPYQVILGVRSSVFLPFKKLGLVIVDEEHEASFKQQNPAPRYHGRNVALMLANEQKANVLLGTATPSIESAWLAAHDKYGLVQMKERFQSIQMPNIIPIDIKELLRKKQMKGYLSPFLLEKIREALSNNQQVILFQNRRGFAPMIECKICGWVPHCVNCDVSLTYHKGIKMLTCHYCGYTEPVPQSCPFCKSEEIYERGFGTEKVQEDIQHIFPDAKVARMDTDTVRSKSSYEHILEDFQSGKTQILIGTQMISKGLDFDHVSVVGILNADAMLNYPDFRSYERAFQLMTQVSGRAGRKHKQGNVILQTRSVNHPIIKQVIQNDFPSFYKNQITERKLFSYPPYFRLVYLYVKGKKRVQTEEMAQYLAHSLKEVFGTRILGPDNPPVARIQLMYIKKIMIKLEFTLSPIYARERLLKIQQSVMKMERFKGVQVYYDVDPM